MGRSDDTIAQNNLFVGGILLTLDFSETDFTH